MTMVPDPIRRSKERSADNKKRSLTVFGLAAQKQLHSNISFISVPLKNFYADES